MTEKAKIQYVGQFYVHGSAAQKLETKRQFKLPKSVLPQSRPNRSQTRYYEPVAIVSIVLALVLVLSMAFGMAQVQQDWQDYQVMNTRLEKLKKRNSELHRQFRDAYDMAAVESKALGMGMVPMEEVPHLHVVVTPAYREELPELSWTQELLLAWDYLWE